MDKNLERIRKAQADMASIKHMEAFKGRVTVTGMNVNLPDVIKRDPDYSDTPLFFRIESLGPQDDDMRVQIDGVTVFDPQLIVSGYFGETDGQANPNFMTEGFRACTITRQAAISAGAVWRKGARVTVDTFDGWANDYRLSPWVATLHWPNGITTRKTGGRTLLGTSPRPPRPDPLGDYREAGPHFADYYPNGHFLLTN